MSADAILEPKTAESFVRRSMTADRDQLEALFTEALGRTVALTQENQRLMEVCSELESQTAEMRVKLWELREALRSASPFVRGNSPVAQIIDAALAGKEAPSPTPTPAKPC